VRFGDGYREGVVLAYPQVQLTLGGAAVDAVKAAADEMPDALVIVARNFQDVTAGQLSSLLEGTELPVTLRTAVVLRDLQELSYQEIAEKLELPEGTVKSRINRGRIELARQLKRLQDKQSAQRLRGVPSRARSRRSGV
jgi:DNA-directed RNA polymerase specialized sigma24 family protein